MLRDGCLVFVVVLVFVVDAVTFAASAVGDSHSEAAITKNLDANISYVKYFIFLFRCQSMSHRCWPFTIEQ